MKFTNAMVVNVKTDWEGMTCILYENLNEKDAFKIQNITTYEINDQCSEGMYGFKIGDDGTPWVWRSKYIT
jgi:hypothetical protein